MKVDNLMKSSKSDEVRKVDEKFENAEKMRWMDAAKSALYYWIDK